MPDWQEILKHFRGSELQNYFTKILEDNLKALIKPQYVDHIPRMVKGKVGELLEGKDNAGKRQEMLDILDLNDVVDRDISQLSGGELQRFAIAMSCVQKADMCVISFSPPPPLSLSFVASHSFFGFPSTATCLMNRHPIWMSNRGSTLPGQLDLCSIQHAM